MTGVNEVDRREESVVGESSATKTDEPRRGRRAPGSGRTKVVGLQVAVGLGFLAAWELAVRLELLNPRLFSAPVDIVQRMGSMLAGEQLYGRTLYEHVFVTGQAFVIGFATGGAVGLVIALVLGRSRTLTRIFEPYLLMVYAIPKIAIAPLFVLLFGIGIESKIAIVFLGVFFMVFFSSFAGIMGVNEELVNIARIVGAKRLQVMRQVIIPAAMPAILMGVKMAVPFGVIGAVIGEYIAATQGLGWLIIRSAALFDASGYFSALLFLAIATWGMGQFVSFLQSRLLQWEPRRRQELVAS